MPPSTGLVDASCMIPLGGFELDSPTCQAYKNRPFALYLSAHVRPVNGKCMFSDGERSFV